MDHSKAMERGRRIDLFLESPFGILYDPITRKPLLLEGDPSLVHTMMLHEVRSLEMMVAGRFRFNVGGFLLEYGAPEFCLITGLKFGAYEKLVGTPGSGHKSLLRARVFPEKTDKQLRLRDIENYIKGPLFKTLNDEDAVLLFQILVLLRGFLGREHDMCIPPLVYELADKPDRWKR